MLLELARVRSRRFRAAIAGSRGTFGIDHKYQFVRHSSECVHDMQHNVEKEVLDQEFKLSTRVACLRGNCAGETINLHALTSASSGDDANYSRV